MHMWTMQTNIIEQKTELESELVEILIKGNIKEQNEETNRIQLRFNVKSEPISESDGRIRTSILWSNNPQQPYENAKTSRLRPVK